MLQFGTQFIDQFMKPLVTRVVTDMAERKNNLYLQKLLLLGESAKLLPDERIDFVNDYFLQDKTKPFSGTTDADKDFQGKFMDEFTNFLQTRNKLSGENGARQAFLPDKDKKFSETVSRNIFDLSYKITLQFEQARIKKMIEAKKTNGEINDDTYHKELAQLQGGQLKLILIDGVERYISENDAKLAAQDPNLKSKKITPFIAAGMAGKLPEGAGIQGAEGMAQGAGAAVPVAGAAAAGGAQPGAIVADSATGAAAQVTFEDFAKDFDASKSASVENLLEQNGLEVVGDFKVDEKGIAHGNVKDVSGQILAINVDTNKSGTDKDKFKFTFKDSPTKEHFSLSQEDLNKFQPKAGERKSADEVAHPGKAKLLADKKKGQQFGLGKPVFQITAGKPGEMPGPSELGGLPEGMTAKIGVPPPGIALPAGAKAKEAPKKPGTAPQGGAAGGKLLIIPGGTKAAAPVMAKKAELAGYPKVGAAPAGQPKKVAAAKPGGPPKGYGYQPQEPAPAGKPKKSKLPKIAAWVTGGTIAGTLLGAGAVGISSASGSDAVSAGTAFIFKCLGLICWS